MTDRRSARPRRPRSSAELQEQLRGARDDIRRQVRATRAQFDEANARLTARSGRNLVSAFGLGLGLGGLVVVALVVWKPLFLLIVMALVGSGTSELAVALRQAGVRVPRIGAALAGVLAVPVAAAGMWPAGSGTASGGPVRAAPTLWLLAVAGAVAAAVVWRLVQQVGRPVAPGALGRDVVATAFVLLYVTGLGSCVAVLVVQPRGQWWALSFLAIVVASDIFAYATGLRFGRHRMAPRISPAKTWEGFAGAATATVVLGAVLAPLLLGRPAWFGALFGALILVTGTMGDLAESMIKRDIGVKDMSSWLPGHGGFLDRIDSVLPSAAAALLLYLATS